MMFTYRWQIVGGLLCSTLAPQLLAMPPNSAAASAVAAFATAPGDLSQQEMKYLALETEVALANDAQLGPYPLEVTVQKEGLLLNGEVPDNASRLAAERVARRVLRGYEISIVNRIRVVAAEGEAAPPGEPTALDEQQMARLRALIDEEFPDLSEAVRIAFDTQPMPTIVLEGVIPSYEQKLELSRFVRRSFRDLPVVNNLRVRRNYDGDKSFYLVNPKDSQPSVRVVEPRRRATAENNESGSTTTTATLPRQGDKEIATQLGATLLADPVIKNCNIELRVDDGVAWLSGRVESMGQKVRAIKLASVQPGVRYVVNQLEIRPPSDSPSSITVRVPEPADLVVFVERYFTTRFPEMEGSQVDVANESVVITVPAESDLTDEELSEAEVRIKKLRELEGLNVSVRRAPKQQRQKDSGKP